MKSLAWAALVLLAPSALAVDHLPQITGVRVTPSNQRLDVAWDPMTDPGVAGYFVYVYSGGQLKQTLNTTRPEATYAGAVNGASYAVEVAAYDRQGRPGTPSAPVAATPSFGPDLTYLAFGLIVAWVGLWGYALWLARDERRLLTQLQDPRKP